MAISTLNNKIIYTGNGSQTTFVYPFQYDVIGDIQVWVYGIGDIIGQRVYNFTASTASGNLTFTYPVSGSPLPAGHKLLLLRSTSLTQNIDLEEQSTVSLETLEKGYDKACLQLQDAQEKLTRAVIYSPVTEGEISGEELEADIVTTKATATQALALAQTVNSALPNKADLVDGKVPLYQLPVTFEDVPSDNQSYVRKNKAWSNLTPDLNAINNRLNAAEGIGGYLQAYNFGVATPTATQLNDYALSQIQSISAPSEIFNGTRVKNTFNNNLWILTNTPNTIPPVFEWTNNGLDTVSIATTATAGVVKASAATGGVAVAADGTASVNGFNDKFDKTGGNLTGNITISRPTTAVISLVGAGVFNVIESTNTALSLYRSGGFTDRLTGVLSSGKTKWYVYKNGVAKELGLTAANELSYDNTASGLAADNVQSAIDEVAASSGGGGNIYAEELLKDTPAMYYRLNEEYGATTFADSSGNNITATRTGEVIPEQGFLVGSADRAISVDGSHGGAGVVTSPPDVFSGSFSILMFLSSLYFHYGYVWAAYDGATPNNWDKTLMIAFSPDATNQKYFSFFIANSGVNEKVVFDKQLVLVNKYALGVTYDRPNNLLSLYLNGSLVKTATPTAVPATGARNKMAFGHLTDADEAVMTLGEIAIFNKVLTAARIAQLYRYAMGGAKE